MKKLFKDRTRGFYLAFGTSAAALLGGVAYLVVYMATAGQTMDRVFSWLTLGMMLGGAVTGIVTEALQVGFGPVLASILFSVGFANHLVESAYPLADVLTGVPFFGGNFTLALIFAILFGLVAVCQVVSAFMEHNTIIGGKQNENA